MHLMDSEIQETHFQEVMIELRAKEAEMERGRAAAKQHQLARQAAEDGCEKLVGMQRHLRQRIEAAFRSGGEGKMFLNALPQVTEIGESILTALKSARESFAEDGVPLAVVEKQIGEVQEFLGWLRSQSEFLSKPMPHLDVAEVLRNSPKTGTAMTIDEAFAKLRAVRGQ